ncbi:helix-turn-helix domain-containing protein [Algoriphagus sp. NBT04N3]|uniref:helix-turn-helix domain-containing protein n=1 Tax=Algoriphagus sp. NBT04N3 TaxID=2705473 RepID=UPI001C632AEF|nr:helix-turn-helix domain-containing protein [Algoriphagus sp. NBT04N3]QYH40113.1 helix-turn-helix domain-containing protein [Algoriphagus sp. NBT04N3]
MQKFNQLSLEQRYQIEVLNKEGFSQTAIACRVGVHKSTISRELKRNTGKRGRSAGNYSARIAMNRAQERHKYKPKHRRFTEVMKEQSRIWLEDEKLSPELIAARWRVNGQRECPMRPSTNGSGWQKKVTIGSSGRIEDYTNISDTVKENVKEVITGIPED